MVSADITDPLGEAAGPMAACSGSARLFGRHSGPLETHLVTLRAGVRPRVTRRATVRLDGCDRHLDKHRRRSSPGVVGRS